MERFAQRSITDMNPQSALGTNTDTGCKGTGEALSASMATWETLHITPTPPTHPPGAPFTSQT
eukprot:1061628-Alexandrium_andersonii.AAC.1